MSETIIDIKNPKNWANDILESLEKNSIKIPSFNTLEKWNLLDYKPSNKDFRIFNILKENKIRLYHACRTIKVNSYYKEGFFVPTKEDYINLFKTYAKELDIDLSKKALELGIETINKKSLENKIFFTLMPDILLKEAGHYLTFGSELILYCFLNVYYNSAYNLLKNKFGKATIFMVDMPIKELSDYRRRVVYSDTLYCLKLFIKNKEYYTASDCWYSKNIPASWIYSHYHPNECYCPHTNELIKL